MSCLCHLIYRPLYCWNRSYLHVFIERFDSGRRLYLPGDVPDGLGLALRSLGQGALVVLDLGIRRHENQPTGVLMVPNEPQNVLVERHHLSSHSQGAPRD